MFEHQCPKLTNLGIDNYEPNNKADAFLQAEASFTKSAKITDFLGNGNCEASTDRPENPLKFLSSKMPYDLRCRLTQENLESILFIKFN